LKRRYDMKLNDVEPDEGTFPVYWYDDDNFDGDGTLIGRGHEHEDGSLCLFIAEPEIDNDQGAAS
jgi:hypothetical protein